MNKVAYLGAVRLVRAIGAAVMAILQNSTVRKYIHKLVWGCHFAPQRPQRKNTAT